VRELREGKGKGEKGETLHRKNKRSTGHLKKQSEYGARTRGGMKVGQHPTPWGGKETWTKISKPRTKLVQVDEGPSKKNKDHLGQLDKRGCTTKGKGKQGGRLTALTRGTK